jgi:hypothetical protein
MISGIVNTFLCRGHMLRAVAKAVVVLSICGPSLLAQKKAKEPKPGSVELIRLENQWTTGLVKRDRALFDRLLAPKFVYTEDDKLMRREEVLHEVSAGSDTVTAARNEGMQVHEFGAVTAVVTGMIVVEGRG